VIIATMIHLLSRRRQQARHADVFIAATDSKALGALTGRALNELITASQPANKHIAAAAATERTRWASRDEDVIGQNSYELSRSDSSINERRHI